MYCKHAGNMENVNICTTVPLLNPTPKIQAPDWLNSELNQIKYKHRILYCKRAGNMENVNVCATAPLSQRPLPLHYWGIWKETSVTLKETRVILKETHIKWIKRDPY